MRVDKERKSSTVLSIRMKARIVVGRGEKSLICDPGSELLLGREKEKTKSAKIIHVIAKG